MKLHASNAPCYQPVFILLHHPQEKGPKSFKRSEFCHGDRVAYWEESDSPEYVSLRQCGRHEARERVRPSLP